MKNNLVAVDRYSASNYLMTTFVWYHYAILGPR